MLGISFALKYISSNIAKNFDIPLLSIFIILCIISSLTIYSATSGDVGYIYSHLRNIILSLIIIFIFAKLNIRHLKKISPFVYIVGVILLIAVELFGISKKGAQRWINIGITIQPSEILKIGIPLMLAWYYNKKQHEFRFYDYIIILIILLIPCALIARQPDLGTAILVFAAGFYVIFFAGLSWYIIGPIFLLLILLISGIIIFEHTLCSTAFTWQPLLHDYQKHRVCTLLNPNSDPLGKGFHILQSIIAIGSGGLWGKGWQYGTQSQLEFIPERHTDFIFAVYGEEFGLIGALILLIIYSLLIFRSLYIARNNNFLFAKLLAGAISLIFFTYALINIGMVAGIFPVVGVPLPLISYGGTSLVSMSIAIGILMSINKTKHLNYKL